MIATLRLWKVYVYPHRDLQWIVWLEARTLTIEEKETKGPSGTPLSLRLKIEILRLSNGPLDLHFILA